MARESGLDGNLRGFKVSYFADEDDVWILPQKRTQGGGKVQSNLFFHLDLVDAAQLKFNRILSRHDVGVGLVQTRN